ncbi:MAG: hypothetical protein ACLRQF_02205 [Thomasclavelia ramosa]
MNWIPLDRAHWQQYLLSVVIGLVFRIWFIVFKFIIENLILKHLVEDDDEEVKLVSKAEYKASKEDTTMIQLEILKLKVAMLVKQQLLAALGGKDNMNQLQTVQLA